MKKIFGLFGTGGFGREVMPFVRRSAFFMNEGKDCTLCFVGKGDSNVELLDDVKVITEQDFMHLSADLYFNIAIADPKIRRLIAARVSGLATPVNLIDETARLVGKNRIGEAAIFCSFSLITTGTTVGRFFHGNYHSSISHDCIVGDFVTFSPGAACGGNVVIGDGVYVGTGAVIRNGKPGAPLIIGEGATIGMGAVVTKDVKSGAVVVGNPARELATAKD